MERKIIQLLKNIGLKISNKGFRLWVNAIIYAIKNPKYKMMELYENVANDIDDNPSKNERAMRHAIEILDVKSYFDVDYKITNRDFLALCIDKLNDLED